MMVIVGIAEAKASADPADVLATFALGSCVGVALYDPVARVAGLLHAQLPAAAAMPERAAECPLMFADTGVAWLLREMAQLGADQRRVTVRIAGAAEMLSDAATFAIGRKNLAATRQFFRDERMAVASEHVGGGHPRTLYLNVANGSLAVRLTRTTRAA